MRTAVWPGDGLVQRAGDTVLVVLDASSADDAALDDLFGRCRTGSGAELLSGLARVVLDAGPSAVPVFAVVTADPGGLLAFCRGAIEIGAVAGGASVGLTGADAVNWIERRLPAPIERVSVGPPGLAGAAADRRCDLIAGVVTGGGVSLIARDARAGPGTEPAGEGPPVTEAEEPASPAPPSPAPGPEPVAETVGAMPTPTSGLPSPEGAEGGAPSGHGPLDGGAFESVPLRRDPSLVSGRDPLPVQTPEEQAPEPQPTEGAPRVTLVRGVRCSRDHLNNPKALYCSSCGIRMGAHRTLVPVEGPRPPLGVFVFDDGSTIPVQHDMVIGRDPSIAEAVVQRKALPIRIEDDTNSVSRAHLHVILEEWDVLVADHGSSNGTRVRPSSDGEWRELGGSERIRIGTGAELLIGERRLVFDQHHVA